MRNLVEPRLAEGETALAWFEPDLDQELRYAASLVWLTDRQLIEFQWDQRDAEKSAIPPARSNAWPLADALELRARDQARVGTLELTDPAGLQASWRYTAARAVAARRLAERLEELRTGQATTEIVQELPPVSGECEVCAASLREGDATCRECGASVPKPAARSLLRLFSVARKYIWMSLFGTALTLAATSSGLIPPYLTGRLMDGVLVPFQTGQTPDTSMVKWYMAGLLAASILGWGLTWAQMYVLSWVSERVSADLRSLTYSHMQRLSLEYFGGKRTGDLISRVSSDTDRICYFLSVYVLDFGTDIVMLLLTAVTMVKIDPWLAVATLIPMPFIALLVFRVQQRMGHGFSLGNRAWSEMTSILADTIPGIRVVKAFAQEEREIQRFNRANASVLHTNDRVNRVWAYFNAVVILLTDLGVLVVWMFGVWRVFHHSLTVGVLTMFVTYISRFYARLDSMSRMASATQRAAASAQRVFGVLDRVPKVPEPTDPVHPGRLKGSLEVRDIDFRYGSRPILKGVSLRVEPGEMIGLVGQSGAGKTTLINLLCRFYDVTGGSILADGVDIRRYPIGEFRGNVGLVLQEPFLFYGSVAENIAYGKPGASRDDIISAARAARAHEFILRLPNGYDSLVGERGQFLSGGERQRVSIARALLIDPRILILDEATSSVDSETEREIQAALQNLIQGRTTIAIAHRLSTLQRADRLVVLERGEIVEVGPHAELLEKGGAYSRLYAAQQAIHEGRFERDAEAEEDAE
jgi:ATP-binding cassette subfamily B protein